MAKTQRISFSDMRWNKLVQAVKAAQPEAPVELDVNCKIFTVEFDPHDLQHLLEVKLNGKFYSLNNDLPGKAKLAEDGFLGPELVQWGARQMRLINERKQWLASKAERDEHRARRRQLKDHLRDIWGNYTDTVWSLDNHEDREFARQLRIAKLCRAILMSGKTFETIRDCIQAGIHVPFLSREQDDWTRVKELVKFIRANEPKVKEQAKTKAKGTLEEIKAGLKRLGAPLTKI